MKEIETKII